MGIKAIDPVMLLAETNSGIQTYSFSGGQVCLCTMRDPHKQTVNEDALAVLPVNDHCGVLVLADGLGGAPQGDKAAETVIRKISASVVWQLGAVQSLRERILDGIEQANAAILANGLGSAATALVAEVNHEGCRIYHAGDSTALVTGQRGRIKYQTIAHSPVGYALEAGLIDEAAALLHEDRHIISNMVGSQFMRLEVGPLIALSKFDTLLLSSDGVYDNLLMQEIVDIIRCGVLEHCANELAALCQERMLQEEHALHKPDDMSFILFRSQ